PGRDPGHGRLHAADVRVPRRPACVHLGHRDPERGRDRAARPVRRQHNRADPAVLGRRLHLVHDQPVGHGPPLARRTSRRLALAELMVAYLDSLDGAITDEKAPITFVILPQFVARHWWERPLYNQSTRRLRAALIGRPHTVVVDVPYLSGSRAAAKYDAAT